MATKPRNSFAPPKRTTTTQSDSVGSTFVDVNKLAAAETTKMTIRLPKALHKDVKARALADDISVQDFVRAAISEKLDSKPA